MKQAVLPLHGCKREDDVRDRSAAVFNASIRGSMSEFPAAQRLGFFKPPIAALDLSSFYPELPVFRQTEPALGIRKAALD